MIRHDFAPVAATLRDELERYFAARGRNLRDPELRRTIATNSDLVEQRAQPLVRMLADAGVTALGGRRVLDLGCGFGALAAYFAAGGAQVHGIDVNAAQLDVGRTVAAVHRLAATFTQARMQAPAESEEPFDVAIMNNTLCYLIDYTARAQALEGTARVLRSDGVLLIRELNAWHPFDQFTGFPLLAALSPEKAAGIARLLRQRRPAVRIVSPRTLMEELREAGYLDVRHLSDRPGLLVRLTRQVARYQHVIGRR